MHALNFRAQISFSVGESYQYIGHISSVSLLLVALKTKHPPTRPPPPKKKKNTPTQTHQPKSLLL